jgi:hypothetical protein
MGTAVLAMPKGICAPCEIGAIGTIGAFFEPPWAPADTLASDEKLIRELVGVLDKQLLKTLGARTNQEFDDVRQKTWPRYIRALRALQDTVSNVISAHQIARGAKEARARVEADLQKQRASRFGEILTEQAVFTLWTLGKIRSLGKEISDAGDVSADKKQADGELVSQFCVSSLWAQFHLDMLVAAMKFDRPIAEDIRRPICDGLRAAVNAYVIMKDAIRLRQPHAEDVSPAVNLPWDEEDERLLASSMRDMNANFADTGD